jgi:hypothetical protein
MIMGMTVVRINASTVDGFEGIELWPYEIAGGSSG